LDLEAKAAMVASDLAATAAMVAMVASGLAAKAAMVALVSGHRRKCFRDRMWCLAGQSKTGGPH